VTTTGNAGLGTPPRLGRRVLADWLQEDVGTGDITSLTVIRTDATCRANLLVKEPGVVAGLSYIPQIFHAVEPTIEVQLLVRDGDLLEPGPVATVTGPAWRVLTGERLALNLLGHLSGIATLTRRYVDAVAGTGAVILDTRKTTPGLRSLEKWAVRCGGGTNHRMGLHDAILIKDNHLLFSTSIATAVADARVAGLPVEVECDTLDQVRAAVAAGADRILLDNMTIAQMTAAVDFVGGRIPLEASGGVSLDTVSEIARTGVDYVSVGALTHAARSLDVSMEVLR
jgi:nicotinate-nucleotide pyrophosphorylase (carboxylating)